MARRRAHGEGSVFQQADGRWICLLELPRDPITGKRRRKKVSASTQREVLRKRDALLRDMDAGAGQTSHTLKVSRWLQAWADERLDYLHEIGKLRPSTVESYRRLTRNHLIPQLGGHVLRDLTPTMIERAYVEMMRGGLAPSSVARVHSVLGKALDDAHRDQRIARNPCRLVDLPHDDRADHEAPFLEQSQVRELIRAAPDWDRALWAVMGFAGLRLGEALGLTVAALDLDNGNLEVRQTLRDAKGTGRGGVALGPPKSASSARTVPLTEELVALLRAHRRLVAETRLAAAMWDDECPAVFPSRLGTWQTQSNVQRRFRRLRGQIGLPDEVRPHTLRHSAGAAMEANGASILEVSAFLGHKLSGAATTVGASTTTGRYLHVADSARRLREAVERAWESA